jgi:hypothetical protein
MHAYSFMGLEYPKNRLFAELDFLINVVIKPLNIIVD